MSTPSLPQHCPTPVELDDLELLVTGALAPLTRFNEPGSVVTLTLPPELADADAVADDFIDIGQSQGFEVVTGDGECAS